VVNYIRTKTSFLRRVRLFLDKTSIVIAPYCVLHKIEIQFYVEYVTRETMDPLKAKKVPWKKKIPITLGEQVEENIREWCAARNIPVPPEDLAMCKEIDAQAAREFEEAMKRPFESAEKPAYGTPEFWKQYWAKKNAAKAAAAEK